MPLNFFYSTVQKVKNDQKPKSRGSCLKAGPRVVIPESFVPKKIFF